MSDIPLFGTWDMERLIHYYDYAPSNVDQYPRRDAVVVSYAFIHRDDWKAECGVIFLLSGVEHKVHGVDIEKAIETAKSKRGGIVDEIYKAPKWGMNAIYTWSGSLIRWENQYVE